MVFTETIMDHLASALGAHPTALRVGNLYKEGETTHFDQELVPCCAPADFMASSCQWNGP